MRFVVCVVCGVCVCGVCVVCVCVLCVCVWYVCNEPAPAPPPRVVRGNSGVEPCEKSAEWRRLAQCATSEPSADIGEDFTGWRWGGYLEALGWIFLGGVGVDFSGWRWGGYRKYRNLIALRWSIVLYVLGSVI